MRKLIFFIFFPIIWAVGKLHAPFAHKRVSGESYLTLKNMVKPGGVLLTRTRGEATNLLIPGFWKHAALVENADYVIEAVGSGVKETVLAGFVLKKDFILYLEPKFTDEMGMKAAVKKAIDWLGLPYDYSFDESDEAFYCGEVVVDAYAMGRDRPSSFHGVKILGHKTFCPDKIANAHDLWAHKWDNLP